MFGIKTLQELKKTFIELDIKHFQGIYQRIIPLCDIQQLGMLMCNVGFKNVSVDSSTIVLEYETLNEILHELRGLAQQSPLVERPKNVGRQYIERLQEIYPLNKNNKLEVTIEFLTIIGNCREML